MALTVEEIQIVVDAQVDNAINGLDRVDRESNSMTKSLGKAAKFIAGVAVTGLIVKSFIKIGVESSKLAAQAEEIQSKFNVVFGETASDVQSWADTYSEAVGRSETDTLKFLGVIGDTLKPLGFAKDAVDDMSKQVVALAGDLGSFNDIPTQEVVEGIQSALVGNVETLRRYGVVANETSIKQEALNSGLWDGEGALTAQEKAQAILNITMRGTQDAQGDLERTQDSHTNTMIRLESATKDLKTELGKSINEGLTPMAGATADLVRQFATWLEKSNEINEVMKEITQTGETQSTNVGALESTYKTLSQELENTKTSFEQLNRESEQFGFGVDPRALSGQQEIIKGLEWQLVLLDGQIQRQNTIAEGNLKQANFEKQFAKEIAAEKEKQRKIDEQIAQDQADTLTRQEAQNSLLKEFTLIDEQAKVGLIDKNTELAKETALRETLFELIEEGFTAEGQGIANVIAASEEMGVVMTEEFGKASKVIEEATFDMEQFGTSIINVATTSLETLGQALVEEGASFQLFGKIALGVLADVLSALGAQLAAQAALEIFAFKNPVSGAGLLAGSAAAFLASGVIRGASNVAFAEGGSFLTNGSQNITVGDNAGGVERVTVEPVSSVGANQDQGIGSSGTMILNIDGQQFTGWLQNQLDNGELRVPRRLVV